MPGRKPETFQIGQKMAQAGAMNKPLRPIEEKRVLLQKKGATEQKRSVAQREPLCVAAQGAVSLKSSADQISECWQQRVSSSPSSPTLRRGRPRTARRGID